MAYNYREYPKCLYHWHPEKEYETTTVHSANDERALGRGWVDSPAKVKAPRLLRIENAMKTWWHRWQWIVGPVALICAVLSLVVATFQYLWPRVPR